MLIDFASAASMSGLLAQAETVVVDQLAGDAPAIDMGQKLSEGLTIAAAGLAIVFTALLLISLFIAALPRILVMVGHIWPEPDAGRREAGHPESQVADDTDVLAAIGFVLHTEFQRQLSAESSTASKN